MPIDRRDNRMGFSVGQCVAMSRPTIHFFHILIFQSSNQTKPTLVELAFETTSIDNSTRVSRNLYSPLWCGLVWLLLGLRWTWTWKKLIVGRLIATHWPTEKLPLNIENPSYIRRILFMSSWFQTVKWSYQTLRGELNSCVESTK